MKSNSRLLIAIITFIGVAVYVLSDFILDPRHVVTELGGDSAKNYFTYLYHALHGGGMWFSGLNYPYGEHIVYADGQPLLSITAHLLKESFSLNMNDLIAFMFLTIAASYILAMVFVYKILKHYKLPYVIAIIFSILVITLSPQQIRMFGHYGLGYVCIIPMLLYWLILYHETKKLKYTAYIFVLGILSAFLHPYHILVFFLIIFAYATCYSVLPKHTLKEKLRTTAPLFVAAIGIFAVVKLVMSATDPAKDRPVYPLGSSTYRTTFRDVLNSEYSDLGTIIPVSGDTSSEGFSYIGIIAALITALTLLHIVVLLATGKFKEYKYPIPFIWLCISFICLMVAMGVPFIWHMEWLMNYVSVFRQFRAVGRLGLVFYYFTTIFSVVVIYYWFDALRKNNKRFAGFALMAICIVVWSIESLSFAGHMRVRTTNAHNLYKAHFSDSRTDIKAFLKSHRYSENSFQGILTLPYIHVGTEKIWLNAMGDWAFALATRAGLILDIPIVNVFMSRSSWSQAFKQVKMVGGPYASKSLLHDMPSNNPLLIMYYEADSLDPDSKYLLRASDYIGFYNQTHLYAFYPQRLLQLDKQYSDSIQGVIASAYIGDTSVNGYSFVSDHFDTNGNTNVLFGNGAGTFHAEQEYTIGTYPVTVTKDSMLYELSLWVLVNNTDYRTPQLKWYGIGAGNDTLFSASRYTAQSVDSKDMWLRVGLFRQLPLNCRKIVCTILNSDAPDYLAYDELLIRPADAIVLSKNAKGNIMVNNHLLK